MASSWALGEVSTGAAQQAAYAAHSAAREAKTTPQITAARAAGHAAATAHFADRALIAANYSLKTIEATNGLVAAENAWQLSQLPAQIRDLATSGFKQRFP